MTSQAIVREQLVSARGFVRAYFEVTDCPWHGRFHAEQVQCQVCVDGAVCQWLYIHDPDPDLMAFSPQYLEDALFFAVGYLEGEMTAAKHATGRCSCEICAWVRRTLASCLPH